jgi:hypothetical protein
MAISLTHARLRELLDYDPETGRFTWRINLRGPARAGMIAGTLTNVGYRQIRIDQEFYLAGPLAVFYMTEEWPPEIVDHINLKRDDNRWSNLRLATHSQNHANAPMQKRKCVPFKGVRWNKKTERYVSGIRVNYRYIHLGNFDAPEEAHAAYLEAAKKHFGAFARGA